MKKIAGKVLVGIMVSVIFSSYGQAEEKNSDVETMKLIKTAMSSRVMIQKVAKAYLYAGNDVATTKAEKELQSGLKKFDGKLKKLNESLNDPKVKNLLIFIESNREEIGDLLQEPYSLENAQEIIDLSEAISEGELSIANKIKMRLKGKVPSFKGQRYYVTQVAKYYMAYRAGIKDKNTVKKMNQTVNALQKLIEDMKAYPGNTPEMNQLMTKIDKQWKIVHQFYKDIEAGDLPLIVYDTTIKLNQKFLKYAKALIKSKADKK